MPGRFRRWRRNRRPIFSASAYNNALGMEKQQRAHARTSAVMANEVGTRVRPENPDATTQMKGFKEISGWVDEYSARAKRYKDAAEKKKPWILILRDKLSKGKGESARKL